MLEMTISNLDNFIDDGKWRYEEASGYDKPMPPMLPEDLVIKERENKSS